jgi:DNA-binding response OmpR family regulator
MMTAGLNLNAQNQNQGPNTSLIASLAQASQNSGKATGQEALGRILVVEDETEIRDLIVLHLKRASLEVDAVASAEEAYPLLEANTYSLVALDWMLPGASGVDITKRLRATADRNDLAILMVTARAEAQDIVEGLDAGADDYLTKPFEPQVLIARVRALLRRNRRVGTDVADGSGKAAEPESFQIGDLTMDAGTYEVKCCNEQIQLTPSEFKLLQTLAQNRGRVLTRESLIQHVQGEGVSVVGRTVDTHVFGLRKKLGDCADVIETVRGIGYRVKAGE